jgi:hypothetical protein
MLAISLNESLNCLNLKGTKHVNICKIICIYKYYIYVKINIVQC